MKIQGNPGPDRITVTFEESKFKGKSVTMDADQIVGGVVLDANSIKGWDGEEHYDMDDQTKTEVIALIKEELKKYPPSTIIG